ncbi:phage portal protein [Fusobacteria bacterium ZRK30]|nr:phage portal protein [Fusobacteria bacterium ZRK30]
MELSLKKYFPGLAARRIRAETKLYHAEKTYEKVVQFHNHGAGTQNAMDYDDEINSADVDIGESKDILVARSRDEFMGNAIANGAVKRIRSNVIGTGIKLKASIDNNILNLEQEKKEEIEKNIENLWRMWAGSTECDWGRQSKLSHIQSLAILTSLIDGECFAALSFKLHPGELFGLKIRLLDPASCINPSDTGDKDIKNGVEKDKNGIITAYHFKKNKEGSETTKIQVHGSKTGRKNLLVLMDKERIGQRRGVPLIAPVLEILHQMRKFTHAELMAATINSYFTAFLENETQKTKSQSPFKPKNGKDFKLKSGTFNHLAPGQKIVFPDSNRPNSGFTKFMDTMCVHLGAALELSPEQLLLKFSNNYSASKGALLESWKMLKTRRQWFTDDFMQPIYEEFLDYCVAMDYIDLPGYEDPFKRKAYQKTQWFGQAPGSLDPLREAKAAELRIKYNLTTGARESMEINGSDIDDNIEQRGREVKKMKKYGLINKGNSKKEKTKEGEEDELT